MNWLMAISTSVLSAIVAMQSFLGSVICDQCGGSQRVDDIEDGVS